MKRVVLNYLVFVAISATTAFTSCNKETVQLLKSTTYSDGSFENYEYDNENRIMKTSHFNKEGILTISKTFSYSENVFVKVTMTSEIDTDFAKTVEYSKSENKITVTFKDNHSNDVETITVDLDNNGFPTKYELLNDAVSVVGVFEIYGGNLTKHSYKHTRDGETLLERSSDFKYDNKKSPLYHCKTPKWWWILSDYRISTQNNVIEMSDNNGKKVKYKYEFDNAGFPTKCIMQDSNGEYAREFKYK